MKASCRRGIASPRCSDVSAITFLGERLAEERPSIKTWNVGSPAAIPFDAMPKQTGVYNLAGGLRRESFYPIVQGYKDSPAVGMRVNFSDRLAVEPAASSRPSYSPDAALAERARTCRRVGYDRYDWRARAAFNNADFYDLVRPDQGRPEGVPRARGAQAASPLR